MSTPILPKATFELDEEQLALIVDALSHRVFTNYDLCECCADMQIAMLDLFAQMLTDMVAVT